LSRWEAAARTHMDASQQPATDASCLAEACAPDDKRRGFKGRMTSAAKSLNKKSLKVKRDDDDELMCTDSPVDCSILTLVDTTDADDEDIKPLDAPNKDAASLSALIKRYHAAPDVSVIACEEIGLHHDETTARPVQQQASSVTAGRDGGSSPTSATEDEESPPTSPESIAATAGTSGSAIGIGAYIEMPRVQRPDSNWNQLLLDNEEEEEEEEQRTSATEGANSNNRQHIDNAIFTDANEPKVKGSTDSEDNTAVGAIDAFLRQMIDDVWIATHPAPDFDTEAERVKAIPKLVDQTMKYMLALLGTGNSTTSAATTFPRFYESSMTKQCNRLMRWLKTWRREHNEGGAVASFPGDTDSDDDEIHPARTIAAGGTKGRHDAPLSSVDYDGMIETSFLFDSRGGRHSARIARKEAMERQREEEDERARQQQRGYFSNDTSALGGSVCTAGGEGSMTNLVVISGPSGIGKTAAAYYAAGRMGYRVVEINTSTKRSPKHLEKLIAEATQSRQIQNNGSRTAGRSELEKWKAETEERMRAEAAAADAARLLLAAQEAEQRAKDEAIEAMAAELARKNAKRAAGVKRENVISKAAIASFFQPRVKSKPPPDVEVLDVDVPAPVVVTEVPTRDDDNDDSVSVVPPPLVLTTPGEHVSSRKRSRSEATMSAAVSSATTPTVVDVDCDSPQNTKTTTTSPNSLNIGLPPPTHERLPLILIESADVLMEDEVPRAFYATIRAMAAESKYPIIVTSNQRFTPQQMNAYFGHGTPHAMMEAPTPLYAVAQLAAIVLVELGFVTCTIAASAGSSPTASRASTAALRPSPRFHEASTQALVLNCVLDAIRNSSPRELGAAGNLGYTLPSSIDIRKSLRQLRYKLLSMPSGVSSGVAGNNAAVIDGQATSVGGAAALRQDAPVTAMIRHSSILRSVVDTVALSFNNALETADCECFAFTGDEDEVGAHALTVDAAQPSSGGGVVARALFDSAEKTNVDTSDATAAQRQSDEQLQQQLRVAERAAKKRQQDLYTALLQPSLAWFASSGATMFHLDEYLEQTAQAQPLPLTGKPTPEATTAFPRSVDATPRQRMCHQVVHLLHRTRSMAAKAYSTRSSAAMFDVLQFGSLTSGGGHVPATRK
jgi:hypothetical protein